MNSIRRNFTNPQQIPSPKNWPYPPARRSYFQGRQYHTQNPTQNDSKKVALPSSQEGSKLSPALGNADCSSSSSFIANGSPFRCKRKLAKSTLSLNPDVRKHQQSRNPVPGNCEIARSIRGGGRRKGTCSWWRWWRRRRGRRREQAGQAGLAASARESDSNAMRGQISRGFSNRLRKRIVVPCIRHTKRSLSHEITLKRRKGKKKAPASQPNFSSPATGQVPLPESLSFCAL